MAKVPFNEAKFKQFAGNCTAEYVNYIYAARQKRHALLGD